MLIVMCQSLCIARAINNELTKHVTTALSVVLPYCFNNRIHFKYMIYSIVKRPLKPIQFVITSDLLPHTYDDYNPIVLLRLNVYKRETCTINLVSDNLVTHTPLAKIWFLSKCEIYCLGTIVSNLLEIYQSIKAIDHQYAQLIVVIRDRISLTVNRTG